LERRKKIMEVKNFIIIDRTGIHARPATMLVNSVSNYKSNITIEYKDKQVNLKSIMGVMSLGIPEGAHIRIAAEGEDEKEAISQIEEVLINARLVEKL
jgi:phosphocarrier protein HPr